MDTDKPGNPPRVGSLKTISGCDRELQKIYRATRAGTIDPGFAKSLTYIIATLVNVKRDSSIEDFDTRLKELEATHARHRTRTGTPIRAVE